MMTSEQNKMTFLQAQAQAPKTREERLAELRTAVLAGTYHVSADALAECLLRQMRRGPETARQAYSTKD